MSIYNQLEVLGMYNSIYRPLFSFSFLCGRKGISRGRITYNGKKLHVGINNSSFSIGSLFLNPVYFLRFFFSFFLAKKYLTLKSVVFLLTLCKKLLFKGNTVHVERAAMLRECLKQMLGKLEDPLSKLEMIDDLERLGISYHFENEIGKILMDINNEDNNDVTVKKIYMQHLLYLEF